MGGDLNIYVLFKIKYSTVGGELTVSFSLNYKSNSDSGTPRIIDISFSPSIDTFFIGIQSKKLKISLRKGNTEFNQYTE